jgi:YgiT-type zinc finger domain-containing protein
MTKVCNVCKSSLQNTLTTYTQWIEDRFVVVENVPAWVCEQCGETYFDPEIVDRIQTLIWSGAEPARVIEADVYDLNAA